MISWHQRHRLTLLAKQLARRGCLRGTRGTTALISMLNAYRLPWHASFYKVEVTRLAVLHAFIPSRFALQMRNCQTDLRDWDFSHVRSSPHKNQRLSWQPVGSQLRYQLDTRRHYLKNAKWKNVFCQVFQRKGTFWKTFRCVGLLNFTWSSMDSSAGIFLIRALNLFSNMECQTQSESIQTLNEELIKWTYTYRSV